MPFLLSLVAGAASLIGGAVAGVAGLAGTAASAVGGLASGAGGLLFGPPATLEAMAVPAYYETAGGILGGLPAAASGTIDYLGNIIPSAVGAYQMIKPAEKIEIPTAAKAIPAITAPAPAITKSALPVLGAPAPPVILTTAEAAKPAPNYILLIGLAVLALFLLRKR